MSRIHIRYAISFDGNRSAKSISSISLAKKTPYKILFVRFLCTVWNFNLGTWRKGTRCIYENDIALCEGDVDLMEHCRIHENYSKTFEEKQEHKRT